MTGSLLIKALSVGLLCAHIGAQASPDTAQKTKKPALSVPPVTDVAPPSSALNAELFYQLLVGEMQLRSGEPGPAYSLVLDAARKTRQADLFRRAVEIALQAHSGESALVAARAWAETLPKAALEPQRYVLQMLAALNRPTEFATPLRAIWQLTPTDQRNAWLLELPSIVSRASDKASVLQAVGPLLLEASKEPSTYASALTALGYLQLAAQQYTPALDSAQKAHTRAPLSPYPVKLALDLMERQQPGAQTLVQRYLATAEATPSRPIRLNYVRLLLDMRRHTEATTELQTLILQAPEQPEPWLLLGTLQAQQNQFPTAQTTLQHYLSLLTTQPNPRGHTQACLLLAQMAEKQNQIPQAQGWLDKIAAEDSHQPAVRMRQASLLARQGQITQARVLLHSPTETDPATQRNNLTAEAQLLRDLGLYPEAIDVYQNALQRFPNDTELAYELAITADKAGQLDQMERVLRQIIARQPDYAHAYNALGYALADRNQRLPEAKALIQKALALTPTDPFIQDSLGWVEFRLGHLAEAQRILQAAFQQRPDAEIAAHWGEVLWTLGHQQAALQVWRTGLQLQPDNETLTTTLQRLKVQP